MVLWVSLQCVFVVFPDHAHLLLHVYLKRETTVFAYKYSKGLDVPVCSPEIYGCTEVQWHVPRPTNCGFEPHLRHCVVSLSKSH